ncbi:hypothetical protein EVAR_58462_1, partial [Eumeta japonica]
MDTHDSERVTKVLLASWVGAGCVMEEGVDTHGTGPAAARNVSVSPSVDFGGLFVLRARARFRLT